jgi:hypothetical protein
MKSERDSADEHQVPLRNHNIECGRHRRNDNRNGSQGHFDAETGGHQRIEEHGNDAEKSDKNAGELPIARPTLSYDGVAPATGASLAHRVPTLQWRTQTGASHR